MEKSLFGRLFDFNDDGETDESEEAAEVKYLESFEDDDGDEIPEEDADADLDGGEEYETDGTEDDWDTDGGDDNWESDDDDSDWED